MEGFTHDWMVFVRGPEHSNIQHFVEKVVFHLHESFPRPKRGRARIQKRLDKKCLCSRGNNRGARARPGPFPAPRVALAGLAWDLGARCLADQVPAAARARKRSTGAPGKSAQRKDRQVSRVYSSQPSWVAVGPLGKVQLVTGFGALESGAGGNKHFAPFLPLLEKLRLTCVSIGGSYCYVLRSQFSRLLWPLFEPLGASCSRLSLWELASTSPQPGFS